MALSPSEIAYRRRLKIAAGLSLLVHGACVVLVAVNPGACLPEPQGLVPEQEPIVVHLQPRDAEERLRLVDPSAPSTELPEETDLIADVNARAQDEVDSEGDTSTPDAQEIGEFDNLAGGPPAPPASPPLAVVTPAPQPEVEELEAALADATAKRDAAQVPAPAAEDAATEADAAESEPAPETSEPTPAMEPIVIAKAEVPPLPAGEPAPSRARKPGGVEAQGFANFEAKQHELAPYLKTIREKVEQKWRAALQMRYTGTTPTKAVIECEINPKGELVRVDIVEGGGSVSYGPLCKDAIQSAGPFGPFPFPVPEIYRNENLEIRWTFSFM